eukprot:g1873.t1
MTTTTTLNGLPTGGPSSQTEVVATLGTPQFVRVHDTTRKIDVSGREFTVYNLSLLCEKNIAYQVEKRYTQFLAFHRVMLRYFSSRQRDSRTLEEFFPTKGWYFGHSTTSSVVEERKIKFQTYFSYILKLFADSEENLPRFFWEFFGALQPDQRAIQNEEPEMGGEEMKGQAGLPSPTKILMKSKPEFINNSQTPHYHDHHKNVLSEEKTQHESKVEIVPKSLDFAPTTIEVRLKQ